MVDLSQVRVNGPLVPWVDGFRDRLLALGYSVSSAGAQLHLMSHVSRWLAQEGLGVSELTAGRVEEFLMARRGEGHSQRLSENAMMPLLAYLRGLGVLPFSPPKALTPVEVLVEEYRRYLESERGLAPMSVKRYLGVSRLFLSQRPQVEGLGLGALAASEVTVFVVAECRRRGPAAKSVVTGLRSLLRFLFVAGYTTCELSSAVPAVAGWAGGSLPQPLSTADVAVLLTTDDDRAVGLRDHAIVVVLVRLGLRAGEVAALDLDDLDWRAGELWSGEGRTLRQAARAVDVGKLGRLPAERPAAGGEPGVVRAGPRLRSSVSRPWR